MPHAIEQVRPPAPPPAPGAGAAPRSGSRHGRDPRDLRDLYPEALSLDAASPLGVVLGRLLRVLDASGTQTNGTQTNGTRANGTQTAETQAKRRFTADLVGVVPDLRRYALSLTRDATLSEDLVQQTLLKAWEHRSTYTPGTNLKAWLFTILRNGHVNGRRKHRREVPDPEGWHAAGLFSLADQEHRLDVRDVQAALGRLDAAQRAALLLVAVEGLAYEAAAARLGCPPGTVKSRVSRARDRLAAELGEV